MAADVAGPPSPEKPPEPLPAIVTMAPDGTSASARQGKATWRSKSAPMTRVATESFDVCKEHLRIALQVVLRAMRSQSNGWEFTLFRRNAPE
jgi:hypothetical protein